MFKIFDHFLIKSTGFGTSRLKSDSFLINFVATIQIQMTNLDKKCPLNDDSIMI